MTGNPLSSTAKDTQLPTLEGKGVFLDFADDHGDQTGTATVLAPGGNAAGSLSHVDVEDEDVFGVELSEATDVAISTIGPTDTGASPRARAKQRPTLTADEEPISSSGRRLGTGVYYATTPP